VSVFIVDYYFSGPNSLSNCLFSIGLSYENLEPSGIFPSLYFPERIPPAKGDQIVLP